MIVTISTVSKETDKQVILFQWNLNDDQLFRLNEFANDLAEEK